MILLSYTAGGLTLAVFLKKEPYSEDWEDSLVCLMTSLVVQAVPIEIMKEMAVATGTLVLFKSLELLNIRNPFVGFGVVGMKIDTKFSSIPSNISGFSPVMNPTDQHWSDGNLTSTTSLKELVSLRVFVTWFVILDNVFRRGIFEITGLNQFFNFLLILCWFIIHPIHQTITHKMMKPKAFTMIGGSCNASHIDCGNREVMCPTQPRIRSHNQTIITINNIIGNIVTIPVNKLLLFFSIYFIFFFVCIFVCVYVFINIFFLLWKTMFLLFKTVIFISQYKSSD